MQKETQAIHHGYTKDTQGTMAVPIYLTTAYDLGTLERAANLFSLQELGNIYTRLNNPTTDVFEKRIAALENGVSGLGTSSGMAAIFYAIANIASVGDNIVSASQLYGGTVTLFSNQLKRFGIENRSFDVHNPAEIEKLIDSKTKAIFFETLTNPSIDVPDIEAIAAIAKKHGILTIVDNTVPTPFICRPIDFGCDVVVHSASKYITGQGIGIGGVIVERDGLQDFFKANASRYPEMTEPDASYHGLVYNAVGLPPFTLRVRLSLLRDIGAAQSPFNSWIFIQGLETLPLRIRQHSKNTLAVAEFLSAHPKVEVVRYPGLKSDKNHANANKYFENGLCSGLLSFIVKGGRADAAKVVDRLKLFTLVANIGDSKSIVTHPASTTHMQLKADELKKAGVEEGLIRLSVGLEDERDLIADLTQALEG